MDCRTEPSTNCWSAFRLLLRIKIEHDPRKTPPKRLQQLIEAGIRALQAGDRPHAIELCNQVLAIKADFPRGHYLAGLIAIESGDRIQAEKAFRTTVDLNKKHAAGWAQLARLYITAGEFVKAEGCLQNAVNCQRGKAGTLDLIGTVFRLAGNLAASLEWHQKAAAAAPSYVPIQVNLANAYLFAGRPDDALQILESCVELEPDDPLVHWLLSRARHANSREHVDVMRSQLANVSDSRSVAYLQYAIGKELEDLEEWDAAFDAYAAGAEERRKTVAFDEAAEVDLFAAAAELFTAEWLANQQSDVFDNSPIFVVGQPRTGSTLLDRMLDSHPAVNSAGELRHLGFAVRQATGSEEPKQFSADLMHAAAASNVSDVGDAYIKSTASLRGEAAHVIDKLPSNYLYLPLVLASLPNARVVHIGRGAMDTCFAVYKTLFADAYLYSYDQEELARHYVRYRKLMETWRERFGDRFLDVRYEDLVGKTEETLRSILEFTGLSWNEDCLAYLDRNAAVATQSAAQVREAPHQRSVGRWRKFEKQLQAMQGILEEAGIPLD